MRSVLFSFCAIRFMSVVISPIPSPEFTSFTQKQCQIHQNCTRVEPHASILIAIDGTGSRMFFEGQNGAGASPPSRRWRSRVGVNHNQKWIWKSHVANFWEDYRGESHYFYGPDSNEMVAAAHEIHQKIKFGRDEICEFVHEHFKGPQAAKELRNKTIHGEIGIDIIGFSRGGFAAMELARKLQFDGCGDIAPVFIRWMGLYDPVARDIDWRDWFDDQYDNHRIGNNVLAVTVAERSKKIHSRRYFGYAVKGYDDPDGYPMYKDVKQFDASHAGVGGAPGLGDCCENRKLLDVDALMCSRKYTVKLDQINSANVDSWMRRIAQNLNVPVQDEGEGYYDKFSELEETAKRFQPDLMI